MGAVFGPTTVSFTILPAPWKTWWAYMGYGLALTGAVCGGVKFRVQQLRNRNEQLEQVIATRTAELAETVDRLRDSEALTREANRKLEDIARHDGLTGIANFRHFAETLAAEWNRAARSGTMLALVMADIDFFKVLNDTYGHQIGDDCLRKVAHVLADAMRRQSDLAARYGGEEFVVLLPETDLEGAAGVAERLRKRVEGLGLAHVGSPNEIVTASFGVAVSLPGNGASPDALIAAADLALYEAKHSGRNRVEVCKVVVEA